MQHLLFWLTVLLLVAHIQTTPQAVAYLSEARHNLAATSVGTKVLFAGGESILTSFSNTVDMYDFQTNNWTTANLSVARANLVAVSVGELALFAGGVTSTGPSDAVDIYNSSNGVWSVANLSTPKNYLCATSDGTNVYFGGGTDFVSVTGTVDIYNYNTQQWSNTSLTEARFRHACTSVDGLVFFAGGYNNLSLHTKTIEIYNASSGNWETSVNLSVGVESLTATSVGGKALFAGGFEAGLSAGFPVNIVNIYNSTDELWYSVPALSIPRGFLASTSIGSKAYFGGGFYTNGPLATVDIYDSLLDSWSTDSLVDARYSLQATSLTYNGNRFVFFGGGFNSSLSFATVEIFLIPTPTPTPTPTPSTTPTPTPGPVAPAPIDDSNAMTLFCFSHLFVFLQSLFLCLYF